ncbi:U32 family peptidase [Candidatus Woesearchaeota archaeon]|nr:U32 family peptidase [Candidatus Woesearchaeota archaeon]
MRKTKPELISPAGDWISLRAAIEAGADAVYFGLKEFSMRAKAKNFKLNELKKVVDFCHKKKVKTYLTLNTIVYEEELDKIKKILKKVKKVKVDAIHSWDMAVVSEALKLKIPVHLSTQASVSNSEALKYYKKLGIERVILARECSLEQIKNIKEKVKGIEIETFIHGAMCVSVSGRCFISQFEFGKSANRGECIQPCRREYTVIDDEGKKLRLGNNFIMSPKDLCTLPFIEKLKKAGIDAFKIEGRMRSPEYVKTVTEVYREAVDKKLNKTDIKRLMRRLKEAYNRGFSSGFYLGKPMPEDFTDVYGSKAAKKKEYVGKIIHFYSKINVAEVKIESRRLEIGDKIMIQGEKTGVHEQKIRSMEINHKKVKKAEKGKTTAVKLDKKARKNDKVYVISRRDSKRNI